RLALGLGHQEGEEEAEQAAAGECEQRVADADAWRVAVRRRLGWVRALRQVEKPLQEEEWSDDGEFIELEGGLGIVAATRKTTAGCLAWSWRGGRTRSQEAGGRAAASGAEADGEGDGGAAVELAVQRPPEKKNEEGRKKI
uniref:Uncharacterized protein n=1 Tax=Oryza rufipogon TaxID=4529 RepID=A0A0E0PBE3_ORYRU